MTWRAEDPQRNESGKVCWRIVPYTRGRGLDLGCGDHKAFPHFIGVDNYKDTQLFAVPMHPDVFCDVTRLQMFADEAMDFVYSSHTLEHIEDHAAALKEWWRVVKPGGHLVLYLPHRDLYPHIGEPGANPDHKHDFEPFDIETVMKDLGGWDLLVDEKRAERNEYSFLQVYRKRADPSQTYPCLFKKPAKTACVVRYGGFGDMIQVSYILPALKREGYHVTIMTTDKGRNILEHDPNVDDWIIQDKDQVPNDQLGAYWSEWKSRFTKWVNLCESVEGTFLAMPGRPMHYWPHGARHAILDRNYFEMTAKMAEVSFESVGRFVETEEERADVAHNLAVPQWTDKFVVLWVLNGSSVHKIWPHIDETIARMLVAMPSARIITVGDQDAWILESGWENEERVMRLAGRITIRQTMALAKACQVVIGPETGVLTAVANEANGKIVFLSHSSAENLTKHWRNTMALAPANTHCYPCHQLHYNWDHCSQVIKENGEPAGFAACANDISVDRAYEAMQLFYEEWLESTKYKAPE